MKFRPTMKLAMAIAAAVATGSCLIAAPAKKEPTAAAPAQSRFDQGIAAGNRGDWPGRLSSLGATGSSKRSITSV